MTAPLRSSTVTVSNTDRQQPFDLLSTVARSRLHPGSGAIVFFHGLGCAKSMWEPLLEMADEIDSRTDPYLLVAVDLPGHGDSAPSATIPLFADHPNTAHTWVSSMTYVLSMLAAVGPVHMVAHSASAPMLLEAASALDHRPDLDEIRTNLGTIVSIEGNHTRQDCGIVSEQIAAETRGWYTAAGHAQIGAELLAQGRIDTIAWSRTWDRADAADVHEVAEWLVTRTDADYQILAQRWLDYPQRAYLFGELSPVPQPTLDLMTTIYPQRDTYLRPIPSATHFPMILSPTETLQAVMDAITHFTKE